ncbi:hypothetical protein ACOSP7_030356 [Xanthoceras sorbifolium]
MIMSVSSTNCVCLYSPLPSLNSQSQPKTVHHHRRQQKILTANDKLLWLSTSKTTTLPRWRRTNAVPDPQSLLVTAAVTPPAKSGDITNFLQVSAGLFFIYLVANFVVPYFISKYLGFDQVNEDQKEK